MKTELVLEKLRENKIKIMAIAIVGIVVVALGTMISRHSGKAPVNVKNPVDVSIAVITPMDVPVVFNFSGETMSSKIIEVRPRVSGVLEKILYVEGDKVAEGTPLFQIEQATYKIALRNAEAGVAKVNATLEQATRDEARLKTLIAKDVISRKDYDDALSKLELAQASLASAKTAVEEAQINLGYTTIYAPLSGMISKTNKNEGALISTTGDNILTKITQIDPIYVNFSMSESDYIKIKQDIAKGLLKLPQGELLPIAMSYGDRIEFDQVGKLNFSEAEFGKSSGVMQIRAEFPNPKFEIMPGQFVRLMLKGGIRPNALIIPKRAVIESTMAKQVFIINESEQAELREIKEGPKFKDFVQIVSGLSAGDKVVVDGFLKLQPGDIAKITNRVEEAPKIDEISDSYHPTSSPNPKSLEG